MNIGIFAPNVNDLISMTIDQISAAMNSLNLVGLANCENSTMSRRSLYDQNPSDRGYYMNDYDGIRVFRGIVNLVKFLSVAILAGVLVVLMMASIP